MIIEGLINLIYSLFATLTSVIKVPPMPEGVMDIIDTAFGYISTGIQIVSNFTHLQYLLVLFGVIFALDVAIFLYHIILWVLKKIPMLGIE